MKLIIKFTCILLLTFISSSTQTAPQSTLAQEENIWMPAQTIPFYEDIYPPYLVADQNRTVHAFNSQLSEDGSSSIYYRSWKKDTGWSIPISIILPNADVRDSLQGVMLDQSGKFHLIYYDGSEDKGSIEYTQTWAYHANQSQYWSNANEIAGNAGPLASAALAGDGINNLFVLYTGQEDTPGIYEVHSVDSGESWTEPRLIQAPGSSGLIPYHIKTELDPQGNLHAVWGVINSSALGEAVYYAKHNALSGEWNEPILIAAREGNDYAADLPSIIYYNDELILMYMDGIQPGGIPPTRWMRISRDGGQTWTNPVQPFQQVGENGAAVMLIDSNNDLHLVLANRIGNPTIYGVWHGKWSGDKWSQLELVNAATSEQAVSSGSYSGVNFASVPNAVISQGNILLVTWWHDMADQPPAGYTYTRLDSPEINPVPLLTPQPSPTQTALTVPGVSDALSATLTPTSPLKFSNDIQKVSTFNTTNAILLSITSVIILIIGIVIAYRFFSIRSH